MKLIFFIFFWFYVPLIANSQVKEEKIGFSVVTSAHFNVLNKQFNNLNTILSQKGYPEIYPTFNAVGVGIVLKSAKAYNYIEFSILQSQAMYTNLDRLIPKFQGFSVKSISTKKIWENKKLRLDIGLGASVSKFHFKLIDRLIIQSPFDTLLKNPVSSSGTLDYAQLGLNWHLDGRFGLTYNTNWFKKVFDAYEFSIFIN